MHGDGVADFPPSPIGFAHLDTLAGSPAPTGLDVVRIWDFGNGIPLSPLPMCPPEGAPPDLMQRFRFENTPSRWIRPGAQSAP